MKNARAITTLILLSSGIYFMSCSSAFAIRNFDFNFFNVAKDAQGMIGLPTPTGWVLCNIVSMVTSDIGRGVAVLSVIFLGIGAAFGQIKWGQALMLGVGIAAIFGAPSLILSLGVDTTKMILTDWANGCAQT